MKIISLSSSIAGPACSIACSIKKKYYNNNYKTNIFDYLEISLISVIQICLLDNEQIEYLSNNNIITSNTDGKKSVQFANFDKIISHHDLPENYTDEDYNNFINKYIRRFRKLMNDIMTEDSIYFIRHGYESEDEIKLFIRTIHNINKKLDIHFINIIWDEDFKDTLSFNIPNYIFINLYDSSSSSDSLFNKIVDSDWSKVFTRIK